LHFFFLAELWVKCGPSNRLNAWSMAQTLPELFSDMGSKRMEQLDQCFDSISRHWIVLQELVCQDHHRTDRRIESQDLDVRGHFADRTVEQAKNAVPWRHFSSRAGRRFPYAVQKSPNPLDPMGAPWLCRFKRAHEHLVSTHGIRTKGLDDLVRIYDVTPRLAHLVGSPLDDDFWIASKNEFPSLVFLDFGFIDSGDAELASVALILGGTHRGIHVHATDRLIRGV